MSLKDVVKPNQIVYRCAAKESANYNLSIRFDELDAIVAEKMKTFKVGEKEFEKYKQFIVHELDKIKISTQEKINKTSVALGRLKSEKTEYIKANMSLKKDEDEQRIYETQKAEYDKNIATLTKQIENFNE